MWFSRRDEFEAEQTKKGRFNPSSNGCGFRGHGAVMNQSHTFRVSILLLMDVVFEDDPREYELLRNHSFNPSSNGCGFRGKLWRDK